VWILIERGLKRQQARREKCIQPQRVWEIPVSCRTINYTISDRSCPTGIEQCKLEGYGSATRAQRYNQKSAMPSLYTFSEYSPEWPRQFEQEAARLRELLGGEIVTIHHIGSTSVPGLAAKPIIDLLPLVREITRIDDLTPTLQEAGYKAWGEYGLPGRRYFTKDRGEYRTHNIHIYQVDNPDVERHLALCAYLRNHPDACVAYEAIKRESYALHPASVGDYNNHKNDFIKELEVVAIAWYRQQPR
jgi:GrpB-like predicted nucleotidyltransferase (UPF0157 family)